MLKILHLCIGDVADVRINSSWWGMSNITSIRLHCWIDGADSLVDVADELYPVPAIWFCVHDLLDIRCIFEPCHTMNMRAAPMLPLKPEPIVRCTQNIVIEDFYKLLDAVSEEPVTNGKVLKNSSGAAGAGGGERRQASSGH